MIVGMIEGVTRVLGKAQGYFGLPIRDEQMTDNATGQIVDTMTSAWFPTPKELEALNAGKAVYLNLFGSGHPPVILYVGDGAEPQPDVSREQTLKDVEACLDEAVKCLVDLAGAKPDKHSPNNCRVKIDEARFYARQLAEAKQ